jgi:hypothetical protein
MLVETTKFKLTNPKAKRESARGALQKRASAGRHAEEEGAKH